MAAPSIQLSFDLSPVEAIEYFEKKGYTPTWDWRELWQEAHHRAFTVAKVINLDLLSDVRDEVDRAIREGASYSEFEKNLLPSLKKHGWLPVDQKGWPTAESAEIEGPEGKRAKVGPWRLRTIYHTNLKVATQVGRFRQMTDPDVLAQRPFWQYLSVIDARTTPACRRRDGEVHRADDPWWNVNWPPNHWL